ncbi:HypC/HybG/HupF family hydrogenase formation chaperone [Magnetospira sp. QH-2]|uniref:HypC/HybG/HupF family hydrogenase formation chaperone n=1 Tax=Magnetospira sp. (strain QH-2) TaxID=1288970 RepID=UPI0003E80B9A|nr:HypC/HybG/HupF family hydrogenase formation chaperone [Magnetospira sp. QH-2]CCQ72241.1 Hydrogenase expression/formation protein hypC; Hydrogenase assembly chaperone [Magnetospira sp. QH-2]
MCLAVPMIVIEVNESEALCEVFGHRRTAKVDRMLHEPPKLGDYVLISRGVIFRTVPPDEAKESQDLFREILTPEEIAANGD